MVEEVEGFGAELQVHGFSDSSVLQQCHVVAPESWAVNGTAALVPGSSGHGHRAKSGNVEELIEGFRPVVWIADLVWAWRGHASIVRSARCVHPDCGRITLATGCEYGKRQSTVNRQDAREFIPAEEAAGKALLRAPPRQFVHVVAGEYMPAVERRSAVIAHRATAVLYAAGAIGLIVGQRVRPGIK